IHFNIFSSYRKTLRSVITQRICNYHVDTIESAEIQIRERSFQFRHPIKREDQSLAYRKVGSFLQNFNTYSDSDFGTSCFWRHFKVSIINNAKIMDKSLNQSTNSAVKANRRKKNWQFLRMVKDGRCT
ncbi:hypothetical protein C0J52_06694, partial [Blattella germanica]